MSLQAELGSDRLIAWVVATLIDGASVIKGFKVGSSVITRNDMSKIAKLVEEKKIKVWLASKNTLEKMGASAAYLSSDNIILPKKLARQDLPELKAVCVHEATHAINDMHRLQDTRIIDEASAHIVEAMYMMAKSTPLPDTRLYKEAANCARQIQEKGKASEGALRFLYREIRIYYGFNTLETPMTSYNGI